MDVSKQEDALAEQCADSIRQAFEEYQVRWRQITRRVHFRFQERDWHGIQRDSAERMEVREQVIRRTLQGLEARLGARMGDTGVWARMRQHYARAIHNLVNVELYETFFNSMTRRHLTTVGVDPRVEFAETPADRAVPPVDRSVYVTYPYRTSLADTLADMLRRCGLGGIRDPAREAALIAREIDTRDTLAGRYALDAVEVLRPVFYRNKAAFLVGRLRRGPQFTPLLIAFQNTPQLGVAVDAVLLTEAELGNVFSLTRSYFHVDTDWPRAVIGFLKSVMPQRRVAELYMSLGHNKHGKTELYRELMRSLARSTDPFDVAPGARGMVMIVFALPSFDIVFKIIRDKFPFPKTTSRAEVMERYALVFKHDRAGRLVDAQEFEHLIIPQERFTPRLLQELAESAKETVTLADGVVHIKHLYMERRLSPLDLYLRESPPAAARDAILEYGQSIRDLAATNVFPGDLLLKNFGVNRSGRVVFYDYDELCLVTDCNFRDLPPPRDEQDETRGEPWFYVDSADIFPEEMVTFLGLPEDLKRVFLDAHGDLLKAAWWREMQARHRAGEILDLFPYPPSRRLLRRPGPTLPPAGP